MRTRKFIFKQIIGLGLALAATLNVFAGGAADDAALIQGSWKPVKAELGGHVLPDAVLKIISLKLDSGKYEVFVGAEPDRGTYMLAATSTPKGMSVTGTDGVNHGKTFPAIYELDGDTLRICYDLSGAKRPTEFKSVASTKLYLVTYKRGTK